MYEDTSTKVVPRARGGEFTQAPHLELVFKLKPRLECLFGLHTDASNSNYISSLLNFLEGEKPCTRTRTAWPWYNNIIPSTVKLLRTRVHISSTQLIITMIILVKRLGGGVDK